MLPLAESSGKSRAAAKRSHWQRCHNCRSETGRIQYQSAYRLNGILKVVPRETLPVWIEIWKSIFMKIYLITCTFILSEEFISWDVICSFFLNFVGGKRWPWYQESPWEERNGYGKEIAVFFIIKTMLRNLLSTMKFAL